MSSTSRSLKRSPSFPTEALYAVLFSFMCVTFSAYLTRMISGEQYKSLSSSLYGFLHSPVASTLVWTNIFLSTLFSNILSPCLKSWNLSTYSVYIKCKNYGVSLCYCLHFPSWIPIFWCPLVYSVKQTEGGVLGKEFQRLMCYDTAYESLLFAHKMCLAFFCKTFLQKIFLFCKYLASYDPEVQG